MSARVPPSTLGSLLLAVLQGEEADRDRGSRGENSWGGAAVICPGWEEGGDGLLSHLQRHSGSIWHLWDIINLTRITGLGDRRSEASEERREDQMEEEALKILSTRFLRSPSPIASVLLLGSDPECLSSVLRAAQRLAPSLPALQWIMGYPLSPDSLHTLGGPLGLLAYGEVGRKPISFYIRDALQLIGRAVTAATMVRPDLALIQNMVNCYDKPNRHELPSSGQYLARYIPHTVDTQYNMHIIFKGSDHPNYTHAYSFGQLKLTSTNLSFFFIKKSIFKSLLFYFYFWLVPYLCGQNCIDQKEEIWVLLFFCSASSPYINDLQQA